MKSILGSSWITSLGGYAAAIFMAADAYFKTNGDISHISWPALGTAVALAVLGRYAKQSNVTNASPATQVPSTTTVTKP
jgi:hypothetical protein